jgi:hypothetical protein
LTPYAIAVDGAEHCSKAAENMDPTLTLKLFGAADTLAAAIAGGLLAADVPGGGLGKRFMRGAKRQVGTQWPHAMWLSASRSA